MDKRLTCSKSNKPFATKVQVTLYLEPEELRRLEHKFRCKREANRMLFGWHLGAWVRELVYDAIDDAKPEGK